MLLTSAVLGSGFAVMIAAGTKSISYFGLLAALAVVSAVACDLLLLPVLLSSGGDAPASTGRAAA
jgi:predicted RND superfamily exporter protein